MKFFLTIIIFLNLMVGCSVQNFEDANISNSSQSIFTSEKNRVVTNQLLLDSDASTKSKIVDTIGYNNLEKVMNDFYYDAYPNLIEEKNEKGYGNKIYVNDIAKFEDGYLVLANIISAGDWTPSMFYIENLKIISIAPTSTYSINYTYFKNKIIIWGIPQIHFMISNNDAKSIRLYNFHESSVDYCLNSEGWFILEKDNIYFPSGAQLISEDGQEINLSIDKYLFADFSSDLDLFEFYYYCSFSQMKKYKSGLSIHSLDPQYFKVVDFKNDIQNDAGFFTNMKFNAQGSKKEIINIPESTCWRSGEYQIYDKNYLLDEFSLKIADNVENIISLELVELEFSSCSFENIVSVENLSVNSEKTFRIKKLKPDTVYCLILVSGNNNSYYRHSQTFIFK